MIHDKCFGSLPALQSLLGIFYSRIAQMAERMSVKHDVSRSSRGVGVFYFNTNAIMIISNALSTFMVRLKRIPFKDWVCG